MPPAPALAHPESGRWFTRLSQSSGARAALLVLALLLVGPGEPTAGRRDDARLTDTQLWEMFTDFSEPNGEFHSDNLVSNELSFQRVIPDLQKTATDGAYLGVGPDQNFTYMVAVRPRIAFIVDIRRQNALLHLLYKAVVELSPTRADFLSRLFSRPSPKGLDRDAPAAELLSAFSQQAPDPTLHERHASDVLRTLTGTHRFPLTSEDQATITRVYNAFFEAGPGLRYAFRGGGPRGPFPSYADLVAAADEAGQHHSYLASERHYQTLRELEERNLVVPVVGDFGGPTALRAVARYLARRRLPVAAFYTSNVEFYLFRNGQWQDFARNLALLPVNDRSVLIRSVMQGRFGFRYQGSGFPGSQMRLDPIAGLVKAFEDSTIRTYQDLLERTR
jgi:hypothetical protein